MQIKMVPTQRPEGRQTNIWLKDHHKCHEFLLGNSGTKNRTATNSKNFDHHLYSSGNSTKDGVVNNQILHADLNTDLLYIDQTDSDGIL